MSNVFNEIYGTYYNVVAQILKEAVRDTLTVKKYREIINKNGYGETALQLGNSLIDGKWQLIIENLRTPLLAEPRMPLTELEKRWLKTILLDKRINLFLEDVDKTEALAALQGVEPLYSEDQFLFYDRYVDGDHFENTAYIRNFRTLNQAIQAKKLVSVSYRNNKKKISIWEDLVPCSLEYSAKDDKFRLLCIEGKRYIYLNLGKMIDVEAGDEYSDELVAKAKVESKRKVVMNLIDERKTLERAMIHFSDLEKETEKLDDTHYKLTVYYDKCDETELLFRILSFGPTIKVEEPKEFVALIKKELREQLKCAGIA